jgi:hypothetical protein
MSIASMNADNRVRKNLSDRAVRPDVIAVPVCVEYMRNPKTSFMQDRQYLLWTVAGVYDNRFAPFLRVHDVRVRGKRAYHNLFDKHPLSTIKQ